MTKRATFTAGIERNRRDKLRYVKPTAPIFPDDSLHMLRWFDHSHVLGVVMSEKLDLVARNASADHFFGRSCSALKQCVAEASYTLIIESAVGKALRSGFWSGELDLIDSSGCVVPSSALIAYHPNGSGEPKLTMLATVITDIGQFPSIARFGGLFEDLPHPVWVYDIQTLRFLMVNHAAKVAYGYTSEEFLQLTIEDIRPEFEIHRLSENLLTAPQGGSERSGFWIHQRKNGVRITVDISSHAIFLAGRRARLVFAHDVTEHQMVEHALHSSQEMQQLVINHIPQEIFWKDLRSIYQGCNARFAQAAGYKENAQIVGKTDAQLHWNESASRIVQQDRTIIETGVPLLDHIEQRQLSDGSLHWYLINKLPLHDYQGNIIGVLGTIEDITSRKRANLMLQLQGRAIEASVNAIVITVTHDGVDRIEYANPAFSQLSGYSAEQIHGQPLHRLLLSSDSTDAQALQLSMQSHNECSILLHCAHNDGSFFWCKLLVAPVRNEEGVVTHHVCVLNDTTEAMSYQAELEHQASHDALTKLPNRNLFADRLQQAISYAQRFQHRVWVLFIDLDNFKLVNDTRGHRTGDELLCAVGNRLRRCVRESDTVARFGGDEFLVLLPDYSHLDLSAGLIQKLLDAVAEPVMLGGEEITVTCSIGVSFYSEEANEAEVLLKRADIAMFRAKEAGRNQVQFFEPAMNERIAERSAIEHELRNALRRNEFAMYYQPKVSLHDGTIVGMEALIRWHHPSRGTVSPMRFIGIAEETGLIVPIGKWALREACAQNKAWQDSGFAKVPVAVNLSARQFQDQGLLEMVMNTLRDTGLEARYLEFEVTESHMMSNIGAAIETLNQLSALGIGLSIDDFGTGYSSLAYLKLFPLTCLKIDKSFVHSMLDDPNGAAIVRSIIGLAHSLRFEVIAEGVETAAQLAYLKRNDCDEMQGYLFSPPVPAAQFSALWSNHIELPLELHVPQERSGIALIVGADANEIAPLVTSFMGDPFNVLVASQTAVAYELLALNNVQLIIAGREMHNPDAVEFFDRVKRLYPNTVRLFVGQGFDTGTLLNAVNRAEIFRIYELGWTDERIRDDVRKIMRDARNGSRLH